MAKVISFINYKGGVGKTTTTFHVGCALSMFEPKQRVLLIDADPQTNLTFLCCKVPTWEKQIAAHGSLETVYSAYIDQKPLSLKSVVWKQPLNRPELANIDLIPSNIELLDIDLRLQSKTRSATTMREVAYTHLEQRLILSNAMKDVADDYDYILIDCPPNLYLATQNALYASDGYLVTLMPDHFSTIGATFLHRKIQQLLRERNLAEQILNPQYNGTRSLPFHLCFVKVPVTGSNQHIVARQQMHTVRHQTPEFANKCFTKTTEDREDIRRATEKEIPVFLNEPGSQNSSAYREIAEQFRKAF
jgi:chromosome partitioning protein